MINCNNGKKAHNDSAMIKVGRIRYNSWATKTLSAADIYIFESELVHITKRHSKELGTIGMTSIDFVKFITSNYNEIRKGSGDSFWLVVRRNKTSNFAAIELTEISKRNNIYIVKSASPVNSKQLEKKELLCANDR